MFLEKLASGGEWAGGGLLFDRPGLSGLGRYHQSPQLLFPLQMYQCPYCKYCNTDVNRLRVHAMTQHSVQPMLRCPLCQDMLSNKIHLQLHLTHLHSVSPDCVEKLILTVSLRDAPREERAVPSARCSLL